MALRETPRRAILGAVIRIDSLYVYPVKSCAGIALRRAQLTPRGLLHDREWMVVTPQGRFVTQREAAQLALVRTALHEDALQLTAPGLPRLTVPFARHAPAESTEVTVWGDTVLATDEGDAAASWFGEHLGRDVRLVRFDQSRPRPTDPEWSQGLQGFSSFADGFPVLVISRASLEDLNARLPAALPIDRFRPNVLLAGCAPYAEDSIGALVSGEVRLRLVKPCTRCSITTVDQATGVAQGDEPLRTLRSYRWDATMRGVKFGQNAIVESGGWLEAGALLTTE
jgi:uncharacterized protein YcbX